MSRVKQTYDMYRKRYFMDERASLGEVNTLPMAKDLRWSWTNAAGEFAETTFDEDDHPYDVRLNEALRNWPDMLRVVILHEMTHMRLGWGIKCSSMTKNKRAHPIWQREAARLASLGAPLL